MYAEMRYYTIYDMLMLNIHMWQCCDDSVAVVCLSTRTLADLGRAGGDCQRGQDGGAEAKAAGDANPALTLALGIPTCRAEASPGIPDRRGGEHRDDVDIDDGGGGGDDDGSPQS